MLVQVVEVSGLIAGLDGLWRNAIIVWSFATTRESMALLCLSSEDGTSSSSMTGRGLVLSTAASEIELLVVFSPSLHLLSVICDDVAGGGLQGCNLGGIWIKRFLHAVKKRREYCCSQQRVGCSDRGSACSYWRSIVQFVGRRF